MSRHQVCVVPAYTDQVMLEWEPMTELIGSSRMNHMDQGDILKTTYERLLVEETGHESA